MLSLPNFSLFFYFENLFEAVQSFYFPKSFQLKRFLIKLSLLTTQFAPLHRANSIISPCYIIYESHLSFLLILWCTTLSCLWAKSNTLRSRFIHENVRDVAISHSPAWKQCENFSNLLPIRYRKGRKRHLFMKVFANVEAGVGKIFPSSWLHCCRKQKRICLSMSRNKITRIE